MDINPLEHLTGDIAKSQYNYESILKGLVTWNNSKDDYVTIRLSTTSEPYFRDIQFHTRYYYSKASNSTFSEKALGSDKYAYNSRYRMTASLGDSVVLRVTALDMGGIGQWDLYEDVTLYDEIEAAATEYANYFILSKKDEFGADLAADTYVRYSYEDGGHGTVGLYKVLGDVNAGDTIVPRRPDQTVPGANIEACVLNLSDYSNTGIVPSSIEDVFWIYGDAVYVKEKNAVPQNVKISYPDSGYRRLCSVFKVGGTEPATYSYGDYVYFGGEFFVYVNELATTLAPYEEDTGEYGGTPNVTIRKYNTDYWKPVMLVPTFTYVKGSGTVRYTLETDINGFVLKNASMSMVSDEKTEIRVSGSLKLNGEPSKDHSGLDIFYTSNYAEWPSTVFKWIEGSAYVTDLTKDAYSLQQYSAVMVFNHADPSVKRRNIINYDGPDLDQGLCIMLPCEVEAEEDGMTFIKKPCDGMTFEFILNIWPNHAYDGRAYNDLIINKSQVYVYNVKNWEDYRLNGMSVSTVTPIAKFSMARLLNFYVHDENVGVPDRPVVYKASFIYSASEERWKTYDYYQFPDHVLLSPFGFVDPMSKEAYDVQSAGFPLFANPFTNYDLSPIHTTSKYTNQLKEDPREPDEEPVYTIKPPR